MLDLRGRHIPLAPAGHAMRALKQEVFCTDMLSLLQKLANLEAKPRGLACMQHP